MLCGMESRTATRGDPTNKCVDGCGRKATTYSGRCKSHHNCWYRKQHTEDPNRQCLLGWCTRVKIGRGRCYVHYGNFKHQLQRLGQWPPTAEQVAQRDAADRAAPRPARLVTPVAPVMQDAPSACPDCPATLLIHPVASERVAWVIHNPHCPRIRYAVRSDLRQPDIELPPGVDFLRHAIDVDLCQG